MTVTIIKEPSVYLISRQTVRYTELERFLADQGFVLFHPEYGYFQPAI